VHTACEPLLIWWLLVSDELGFATAPNVVNQLLGTLLAIQVRMTAHVLLAAAC
jgi:hypothetical protein